MGKFPLSNTSLALQLIYLDLYQRNSTEFFYIPDSNFFSFITQRADYIQNPTMNSALGYTQHPTRISPLWGLKRNVIARKALNFWKGKCRCFTLCCFQETSVLCLRCMCLECDWNMEDYLRKEKRPHFLYAKKNQSQLNQYELQQNNWRLLLKENENWACSKGITLPSKWKAIYPLLLEYFWFLAPWNLINFSHLCNTKIL